MHSERLFVGINGDGRLGNQGRAPETTLDTRMRGEGRVAYVPRSRILWEGRVT